VYEAALKKIGLAIRLRREALGFTQEGFAHHAQIARTFYGRIERGEQNLALKTLFVLAEHLRCSPAELLGEISLDDKSVGDAPDNDRRA
jgi:transcriptional regulator with XRE-family HTH domain